MSNQSDSLSASNADVGDASLSDGQLSAEFFRELRASAPDIGTPITPHTPEEAAAAEIAFDRAFQESLLAIKVRLSLEDEAHRAAKSTLKGHESESDLKRAHINSIIGVKNARAITNIILLNNSPKRKHL